MIKTMLALFGLCCLVLWTAAPTKKLTVDWGDGYPLVLVTRLPNVSGAERTRTVQNRQIGLRSDGVVVWREADLSHLEGGRTAIPKE